MKHRIWIFVLIVAGPGIGAGTAGADNNLVTTLLDVAQANDRSYVFTTPRDGWVFVADGDEESMRWVRTGEHLVRGSAGRRLIVRAIPEIIHCGVGYHPSPFLESFPKYNVAYLEKIGVFRNANVILERNPDPDFDIAKWRASGKQIRVRAGSNEAEPEHIYDYWASHRGMTEPYDGIQISEYDGWEGSPHLPHYRFLSDAARRISADPRYAGKKIVPYTVAMYNSPESIAFLKTRFGLGHLQACERYIPEQPSLEKAKGELYWMGWIMAKYREAMPGSQHHSILDLGFMSAPPETLDNCPNANYLVFMDMQMHAVANEPAYKDLYGVMWYHTAYADEEALRWSVKLLRHYCIEGNATVLSKDPYILAHLENGDFANGAVGWTLDKAVPGSIGSMFVRGHKGLSYLQTRYPHVEQGQTFLWTKRSAQKPNRFGQTIRGLEPGRAYSLKMMVCDYQDLMQWRDNKQEHKPMVRIEGAQMLPAAVFREAFRSGRAGHGYEKFNNENNLWITYHRLVFRAVETTAQLTISDWQSPTDPGGPAGQELAFNYISVQPYLE